MLSLRKAQSERDKPPHDISNKLFALGVKQSTRFALPSAHAACDARFASAITYSLPNYPIVTCV